ncbi:MAG: hypothetical protein M0R06_20655, partial [Sphaerochaeta sp.]|nr:hypothetical protein [Sphaerochaeta sp.]
KPDNRLILFMALLGLFAAWLAALIFYLIPLMIAHIDALDAVTGIIAGMGIGGITQVFITLLTLAWQFYFRKKEIDPAITTTTITTKPKDAPCDPPAGAGR